MEKIASENKHWALLGGAFDPPHFGHVSLVAHALMRLSVDRLILVPSGSSRLDKPKIHATDEQRLSMLRALFKDIPRVHISDYEIQHPQHASRTRHTLEHFFPQCNRLTLLMGQDVWQNFHTWFDVSGIEKRAEIVVLSRAGYRFVLDAKNILEIPPISISSADVRYALKNAEKLLIQKFLPHCVLEYIHDYKLYQAT